MMRRHKPENPKAPLPIDPLVIILCPTKMRSFRIFGQRPIFPQMGVRNPGKTSSIVDGKHQELWQTCLKLPFGA